MPKLSSNIEIDKNSICYGNEVLKISNISRTWIFRFQNKEKKAYEIEKARYEEAKKFYEMQKQYDKNVWVKRYIIVCLIAGIVLFYLLEKTIWWLAALAICIICGFLAIREYKKNIQYDRLPPEEKEFPNKFGLGIQMNSGYVVVFATEGEEGVRALKKLQNEIRDVDTYNEKIVFNMNEYNVQVEGDVDGIINCGDDNMNINGDKELLNV